MSTEQKEVLENIEAMKTENQKLKTELTQAEADRQRWLDNYIGIEKEHQAMRALLKVLLENS